MIRILRRSIPALVVLSCLLPVPALAAMPELDAKLLAAVANGDAADFAIVLRDQAKLDQARQQQGRQNKGRATVAELKAVAAASQAPVISMLEQRGLPYQAFWIANVITTRGDANDVAALLGSKQVAELTLTPPMRFQGAISAPDTRAKADVAVEPSIALIGAPSVWDMGYTGQGVVVGDHDIGVEWDHPALKSQYRGWDGSTADHAYNWHNAFGALDLFCTDADVPCDSHGHGTHTTGTMVGDGGSGNKIGVAPGAQWIACRSLLDPVVGVGTLPTYLGCMEWMLAPYPGTDTGAADPDQAPDLINNSWGCVEGCTPGILESANLALEAAGILQVVSAGNDGSNCMTILFPLAIYESSFTVGATDNDDQMASFSSRGPVISDLSGRTKPDISAPGVSIRSALIDGEYGSLSGTSMAGPHVAGVAALLMSAEPRLKGQVYDVRHLIERSSVLITPDASECGDTTAQDRPNNVFGYGRVDALAAVRGIPSLSLVPAVSRGGGLTHYLAEIKAVDTGLIDATNVRLRLTVPTGVTVDASSDALAEAIDLDDGTTELSFVREALAPGASWSFSASLAEMRDTAVGSRVEADQVSPVVADVVAESQDGGGAMPFGGLLWLVAMFGLRGWLRAGPTSRR